MPPKGAVLIETSCTYRNTLLPVWREFACTHTTCPVLQHSSPASRTAWPLKALVLKPRLKLGWQTCDRGLVNKPPFWEKYKNYSLLILQSFWGQPQFKLKTSDFLEQREARHPPASSCCHRFLLFSPNGEHVASGEAEVPPAALQMWQQHQWTSTGHLYGLPWSLMAHLGFEMSERPAKSLFKRAFFFLCHSGNPYKPHIVWTKKENKVLCCFERKTPNYYQLSIGLMLTVFHPQTSQI